jgi:hypothetical protein
LGNKQTHQLAPDRFQGFLAMTMRLGEMSRRKQEITGLSNERDFPHLVELALPPVGFRSVFLEFDAFHRQRRIPVRRGRSRHDAEQSHIRFCFPDASTADAFRDRFGGGARPTHQRRPSRAFRPTTADAEMGGAQISGSGKNRIIIDEPKNDDLCRPTSGSARSTC